MSDFFEILAETRIREAIERGEFDNLPGKGQPLQLEDLSHVPPELRAAYSLLKSSGFLPEEMELQKELLTLDDLIAKSVAPEDKSALAKQRLELDLRYRILMERRARGSKR
ncbi:uncharacterized protein DUF1992 [Hydrogenispora ethanolica]|jgi:hypothetical protein|uniref:Uncharacterized protein DUF1992 n=1 Tax=Hydrogenispora ethanolica TaxID=1082276 RepID=A0A4R1R9B9_HYDET|nr:DnaJ family domain-containing protein [Hydrogenispora ethanolica]TCL62301.1 uncharacterized protein DUF1992 [Hydrogenispora ethanolica]